MSERDLTTADLAEASTEQDTTDETHSARVSGANGDSAQASETTAGPLLPPDDASRFREQWTQVQGEFVDQPRAAVEQADHLVADLMQRLASQFSDTRAELERRWDGQEDVSTEDLRVAMTQYRSFFERLLQA